MNLNDVLPDRYSRAASMTNDWHSVDNLSSQISLRDLQSDAAALSLCKTFIRASMNCPQNVAIHNTAEIHVNGNHF